MKTAFIIVLPLIFSLSIATGFGRNKVQIQQQDWWEIQGRHFTIYFPQGGEAPAESLLVYTERELLKLSEEFNYMPEEPIPIVLYISPYTFRQTDISPGEISQAVGGFTEFYKGRVVVPFTGYWREFHHLVSHEINHAFIFDMLYKRSLLNIITGGTPLWMMEGLAEYTSLGWDAASEAEFRDMVISNRIVSIGQLSRRSDYLVYREGQAIYHFIVERYGIDKYHQFVRHINAQAAKNFSSSGDTGTSSGRHSPGDPFNAVFGMSRDQFSEKFIEWAREKYWSELACGESPNDIGNPLYKNDERVAQLNTVVSPDGQQIAGVEYYHAHFSVTVRSAVTGEVMDRPFVSGGLDDASVSPLYRVCGFSPTAESLAVAVQKLSGDRIYIYSQDNATELPFQFDLIRDPVWSPSGRYVAFAGMDNGVLNIYSWDLQQNELTQVSDDRRGEKDLYWGSEGILCSAEKGQDMTEIVNYDLGGDATTLFSDSSDIRYPMEVTDGLMFLSDMDGYPDLYLQQQPSDQPIRLTTLYKTMDSPSWAREPGILTFNSSDWTGSGVYIAYGITDRRVTECSHGSYEVERGSEVQADSSSVSRPAPAGRPSTGRGDVTDTSPQGPPPEIEPATAQSSAAEGSTAASQQDRSFEAGIAPYSPRLTVDYASAVASYDSYLGMAGYTQVILSDILAHHQVVINTNLNGGSLNDVDVGLFYGYLPHRTDYIFGISRQSYRYLFRFSDGHLEEVRDIDLGGFAQARYAYSPSLRFSGTLGFRKLTRNGTWNSTVDLEDDIVSLSGGIVFDNALWGSVGPRVGSRLSLTGEYAPSISGSAEYSTILMDLRNYIWVSRRVTLATRLAAGSSWGPDGQLFFLGGAIPHRLLWGEVDTLDELLGFYTNYGDMLRGFPYASIQGRRYGIFSLEMRVPFVNVLALDAPLPITITNGRGVFFMDLGTAFNDFSSFRGASTQDGFHLDDLKMGIGLGYRLNLGYFLLKHDIAWNTDLNGISRKPRQYFTLGAEF